MKNLQKRTNKISTLNIYSLNLSSSKQLPSTVMIQTNLGDITLKLFPEDCPRSVENFTTHAKNGYYDNLIFHRVIKNFMV
jgi:hypothetical protein